MFGELHIIKNISNNTINDDLKYRLQFYSKKLSDIKKTNINLLTN